MHNKLIYNNKSTKQQIKYSKDALLYHILLYLSGAQHQSRQSPKLTTRLIGVTIAPSRWHQTSVKYLKKYLSTIPLQSGAPKISTVSYLGAQPWTHRSKSSSTSRAPTIGATTGSPSSSISPRHSTSSRTNSFSRSSQQSFHHGYIRALVHLRDKVYGTGRAISLQRPPQPPPASPAPVVAKGVLCSNPSCPQPNRPWSRLDRHLPSCLRDNPPAPST
jgi:hypothetical protein